MNEWQPIETAPTDGTYVLVYAPDWKEVGVAYSHKHKSLGLDWYWAHDEVGERIRVTHWLPLPEPPKDKE